MYTNSNQKLPDKKRRKCFNFGHMTYYCTKKISNLYKLSIYSKYKSTQISKSKNIGKKEIFEGINPKIKKFKNKENIENEIDLDVLNINEGIHQNIVKDQKKENFNNETDESFEESDVDSIPEYKLYLKSGFHSENKYHLTNREYREFKRMAYLDEELKKMKRIKKKEKIKKIQMLKITKESKKSEDTIEKKIR